MVSLIAAFSTAPDAYVRGSDEAAEIVPREAAGDEGGSPTRRRRSGERRREERFASDLVTPATPGHAVEIDISVAGAKELYLVVTDGGNGYGCDWADWAEPRLAGPDGEMKLTDLEWKRAESGFGSVRAGRNCAGGPLRMDGKDVAYGIGTHAPSVIAWDLPPGTERFRARAGLDNGGTDQGACGRDAAVRFLVFTGPPPRRLLGARRTPGGDDERDPSAAVSGLQVHEELEATLFASEPMIVSPTNLDVDARGRVWVCEVVNYRRHNGKRPEGDRILILEDRDGDGVADESKVFYQGRDIDSAMGICVLGEKTIVSCSPNVFVFHDEDGDDVPERKEVLFTKTGVPQHDHSAHSFVFGPDGKLYWNFGNTGRHVHDASGKLVVDLAGNEVRDDGTPYYGGMVFRCDLDGGRFEVLGHNFRNNYEVAVDSFGALWQSDNDDDGNRGVRINYVMEFGNFGYREEMTGAGWGSARTGMADEVPRRHWHENDPGVVPNLLLTGAGSPTGITVYEGDLLPERLRNEVIHCDAGPNVVRAYPVEPAGAGYRAGTVDILAGAQDKWFRPADACVAPDGSLFVTDWYDPGVGGHNMQDLERGRIFRIAPPGARYHVPEVETSTLEGAIEALKNPSYSVRYLAWMALHARGREAEPALATLYEEATPRLRARALWLLGKIEGRGEHWVRRALADEDPDIRITGVRLARQLGFDPVPIARRLAADPSAAVRRECAIALRGSRSPDAAALWAELALRHDGEDRWHLEALGIAAAGNWDACFAAWEDAVGSGWNTASGRDIVWRSRAARTPRYLAEILTDPRVPRGELPRYMRAFDFLRGREKDEVLARLVFGDWELDEGRRTFIAQEALDRLDGVDVSGNPEYAEALDRVLERIGRNSRFIDLIGKFRFEKRYPDLLAIAQADPTGQLGAEAMRSLLARGAEALIRGGLDSRAEGVAIRTAQALGTSGDGRAQAFLLALLRHAERPLDLRREAAIALSRFHSGARELISLAKNDELDAGLRFAAAIHLHRASWGDVRQAASELFPLPAARDAGVLPSVPELLERKGDPARGRTVFQTTGTCANCHVVRGEGKEVGPDLSEIASKLSREALYESILFPSAGISHNYETSVVVLKNGETASGILVSDTPESVSLRGADAIVRAFDKSEILALKKEALSLMPADLQKEMTADELVDVIEYLAALRKG